MGSCQYRWKGKKIMVDVERVEKQPPMKKGGRVLKKKKKKQLILQYR